MASVRVKQQLRLKARRFEQALEPEQRKKLGQYFTGVRLGKLLAHLALRPNCRTALDCMAGTGDLLDATLEAASEQELHLSRLDGIEYDPATSSFCAERLDALTEGTKLRPRVLTSSAFDPKVDIQLAADGYDLVITNPPFVRYQSFDRIDTDANGIRSGLKRLVTGRVAPRLQPLWLELVNGYSGLSDLSIPSWLLAALLTRPGGTIAIVVPSTWRSRDYADVIRYMLLRFFRLEIVVEDAQPGWFSDALVRTQLVVARRLTDADCNTPLSARRHWHPARWVTISPEAAGDDSLVSAAFQGEFPECCFARWSEAGGTPDQLGISSGSFNLSQEWDEVYSRSRRKKWLGQVEPAVEPLPLFGEVTQSDVSVLPSPVRELVAGEKLGAVVSLEEAGIHVGQGLRTGCNAFFYLTAIQERGDDYVLVQTSSLFGDRQITAPTTMTRPAIKRQAELGEVAAGRTPSSRVLDLRGWFFSHEMGSVPRTDPSARPLPNDIADYVREAAQVPLDGNGKRIPLLSAVRTNVRPPRGAHDSGRAWYMLPDFQRRHLPDVFVARVNQGAPWVEANLETPLLVDANFSTLWIADTRWSRHAIKAILNSTLCRVCMEEFGTRLGGGALKLEAAHLRLLPLPPIDDSLMRQLTSLGKALFIESSPERVREIDKLIFGALLDNSRTNCIERIARRFETRLADLVGSRQRKVS